MLFRGAFYKSRRLYDLVTRIKLGADHEARYKLAAEFVRPGESVVDVCAGTGELQRFLPQGCRYEAVEASPEFARGLAGKGIPNFPANLHRGFPRDDLRADVLVMLISLYQFRDTSLHSLLEDFKKSASKVLLVEDVLTRPRGNGSIVHRAINYLCATDYYIPAPLFTSEEFRQVARAHGYAIREPRGRYAVATWNR